MKEKMSQGSEERYSVEEFMERPDTLDASPDLICAAFVMAGRKEASIREAIKLVNDFKKEEVK